MSNESERSTRRKRIDPKLKASGWEVVPCEVPTLLTGKGLAVEEYETANGPADYGLFDDGRCIGVVEAKKLTVGPQEVLTQAQRYSRGIDQTPRWQGEFGAPFLYSTNGERVASDIVQWKLKPGVVSTMKAQARYTDPSARSFTTAAIWMAVLAFAVAGVIGGLAYWSRDRSPKLAAVSDE